MLLKRAVLLVAILDLAAAMWFAIDGWRTSSPDGAEQGPEAPEAEQLPMPAGFALNPMHAVAPSGKKPETGVDAEIAEIEQRLEVLRLEKRLEALRLQKAAGPPEPEPEHEILITGERYGRLESVSFIIEKPGSWKEICNKLKDVVVKRNGLAEERQAMVDFKYPDRTGDHLPFWHEDFPGGLGEIHDAAGFTVSGMVALWSNSSYPKGDQDGTKQIPLKQTFLCWLAGKHPGDLLGYKDVNDEFEPSTLQRGWLHSQPTAFLQRAAVSTADDAEQRPPPEYLQMPESFALNARDTLVQTTNTRRNPAIRDDGRSGPNLRPEDSPETKATKIQKWLDNEKQKASWPGGSIAIGGAVFDLSDPGSWNHIFHKLESIGVSVHRPTLLADAEAMRNYRFPGRDGVDDGNGECAFWAQVIKVVEDGNGAFTGAELAVLAEWLDKLDSMNINPHADGYVGQAEKQSFLLWLAGLAVDEYFPQGGDKSDLRKQEKALQMLLREPVPARASAVSAVTHKIEIEGVSFFLETPRSWEEICKKLENVVVKRPHLEEERQEMLYYTYPGRVFDNAMQLWDYFVGPIDNRMGFSVLAMVNTIKRLGRGFANPDLKDASRDLERKQTFLCWLAGKHPGDLLGYPEGDQLQKLIDRHIPYVGPNDETTLERGWMAEAKVVGMAEETTDMAVRRLRSKFPEMDIREQTTFMNAAVAVPAEEHGPRCAPSCLTQ